MTIIQVVAYAFIGLALLVYVSYLVSQYFLVERYPDEIHNCTTSDGWHIAVARYRNRRAGQTSRPVVLLHGVGANGNNLDLTDELSLAQYLANEGFDTWLVEFRGRGRSSAPRIFSKLKHDWTFDEYVERDLPAALEVVFRATKSDRAHLVGYSLGGLVAYAHLADPGRAAQIQSAITLGAPTTFRRQARYLGGRLLRNLRWMRHRWMVRILAPVSGHVGIGPSDLVRLHENVPGPVHRRALINVVSDFSTNEMLQYSDWILEDAFRSIDHRRDYRAEMSRITTPILFVAGSKDRLAPPDAVKAAYDSVSSSDKRFAVASRAQGMLASYAHVDLALGKHARTDVFPLITAWILEHEGRTEDLSDTPQA